MYDTLSKRCSLAAAAIVVVTLDTPNTFSIIREEEQRKVDLRWKR